jgi:hypothetical protein
VRIPRWIALLLAVIVLRVPGFLFGVLNIDETDFFIIGRRVWEGAIPYVDIVDIKPPLAYLAYLPAGIGGFSLVPMQLIGVGWLLATCLVLRRAAQLWTGREEVGWAAATAALIASSCDLPAINTESLFNLPIAGALLFFIRAEKEGRRRDDLFSGVLISTATMFKHQAGIALLAMSCVLIVSGLSRWMKAQTIGSGHPLPRLCSLWIGFLMPWLAVVAFYWSIGHLRELYEWNVERNFLYLGQGNGSPWPRLAVALAGCVVGAAPLIWLLAARESVKRPDPIRLALVLCLWLTWIPVSLGGRFYGHYFLQFAPPLALLAAPSLAALYDHRRLLRAPVRVVLWAALLLPLLGHWVAPFVLGAMQMLPGQDPKTRELARWILANTSNDARLFVWGHYSPIYFLSKRLPGTRYVTTSVHMGNFDPHHLPRDFNASAHRSERDVAATLVDLKTKRPGWVVDTAPADIHDWSRIPLSAFPEILQYVQAHYALVARPAGAAVYQRISP